MRLIREPEVQVDSAVIPPQLRLRGTSPAQEPELSGSRQHHGLFRVRVRWRHAPLVPPAIEPSSLVEAELTVLAFAGDRILVARQEQLRSPLKEAAPVARDAGDNAQLAVRGYRASRSVLRVCA